MPLLPAPTWFLRLKPWVLESFPVLECALDNFESSEPELVFGPWEQPCSESGYVPLTARSLPFGERRVVLLQNLGSEYEERVSTLQKARDNLLIHEALEKEIKKKELLLHTIVHDLAGPLTSIRGALHILGRPDLPREQVDKLLEIGVRQTERQNSMIREILDVFAAEVGSLERLSPEARALPLQCAESIRQSLSTAFEAKGVALEVSGVEVGVRGEQSKLERVLSNLIENSLRHVPRGSTVRVTVTPKDTKVRIEVRDDGPGVPTDFASELFKKLSQAGGGKGKVGLGLYFCKLTVEAWGGEIGYLPVEQGGACFWFELLKQP